tara:strand:- start:274 stop:765 length:492 start_codon:yes stop_codon:yes gene_type:complete
MSESYVGKKDLNNLMDKMSNLGPKVISALKSEVYEDAVTVFEESQEDVPVLSGDLRSSGKLKVTEGLDSIRVEISYDEEHAMEVHENVKGYTFHHGKLSRYLQRPFDYVFHGPAYDKSLESRVLERAESGAVKATLADKKGSPGPLADRSKSRHGGEEEELPF